MNERTEADAIVEAARATYKVVDIDPALLHVKSGPNGMEVLDLREFWPSFTDAPKRKAGTVTLTETASFVDYVVRHKTPATTLYADRDTGKVLAVFNDHNVTDPGWGDFRARLDLRATKEWTRWSATDGQMMNQAKFAEHIEQGIDEIIAPPAAEMLELAQHFEAHSKVAFKSAQLLADGSRKLVYEEQIEAKAGQKGDIKIPREFELGISPYEGSDRYKIVARLRYRIPDEHLAIGYTLVRPHDVIKAAFGDVLKAIAEGTAIKPLLGSHG